MYNYTRTIVCTVQATGARYVPVNCTVVQRTIVFTFQAAEASYITIENRIYREEFTRKKCKTAILLYCFHTACVLHIFMLYNLLDPGISFYRKSKIKENQIMK